MSGQSPELRSGDPQIAQVALCTTDLPLTVSFFRDLLGFLDAGGRVMAGRRLAEVQDLPVDEARCTLWWLTNSQELFQLELFNHTAPPIRERSSHPDDPGWQRCGLVVPDLDEALSRLAGAGVEPVSLHSERPRRAEVREPGSGVLIELVEPSIDAHMTGSAPLASSVRLVVPDVSWARRAFVEALGLPVAGEEEGRLTVTVGDMLLEIVERPGARRRGGDVLTSDQGFMNIALGFREEQNLLAASERLASCGFRATVPPPEGMGACYLVGPDGISLELLLFPQGYEDQFGFAPLPAVRTPPSMRP